MNSLLENQNEIKEIIMNRQKINNEMFRKRVAFLNVSVTI
ncbi:MAG: hypothetical protein ACJARZ_002750 [Dokdonia sp.]|jgi:hypothetical protein